jgi:hypothetical protein
MQQVTLLPERGTKMAKKKHKVKRQIRIYFKDGKEDIIPGKLWTDYEVNYGLFVVKKGDAWIAGYSMDIIACFAVDGLD